MAEKPKETDTKHPAEMSGDEIMDEVFSPEVREKLKKFARKHRKENRDDR